ncbi:MAG: glycosyltransferase [Chitinispirillaceae bacterium]|nr:glycosyltransferase [Chitinispirillaceae bacterium]
MGIEEKKNKNLLKINFFNSQVGALSVRLDRGDGTSFHLHSLVDPLKESFYFSNISLWGDRIVLAGCGLGYHIIEKIKNEIKPYTSILVIEYYKELLEIFLNKLPSEVKTRIFSISSQTLEPDKIIKEFLAEGKYIQIIKHPPSYKVNYDFYNSILKNMFTPSAKIDKKDKILIMEGNFFLEKELKRSAEKIGKNVSTFLYKKAESIISYESELQRIINTQKSKIILSVNMLGFDDNGILQEYCSRWGIPILVWFVDDPRPILLNRKKNITSNMIAFCWEKAYLSYLKEVGFSSVYYLPLATDVEIFNFTGENKPLIKCGFVGTSMGGKFLDDIALKFIWKDEYKDFALSVAEKLTTFSNLEEIDSFIKKEAEKSNLISQLSNEHTFTWLRSYIIHTKSMLKRKKIILSLQNEGVEIFGDPDGWREVCGANIKVHNNLDYYKELPEYYKNIAININITSCQMPTAVNQRVFDIPASGGFVLNDLQSDLLELFDSREVATYSCEEELREKVEFYYNNESLRKEIISNAYRRISSEHTYLHRLEKILQSI